MLNFQKIEWDSIIHWKMVIQKNEHFLYLGNEKDEMRYQIHIPPQYTEDVESLLRRILSVREKR